MSLRQIGSQRIVKFIHSIMLLSPKDASCHPNGKKKGILYFWGKNPFVNVVVRANETHDLKNFLLVICIPF